MFSLHLHTASVFPLLLSNKPHHYVCVSSASKKLGEDRYSQYSLHFSIPVQPMDAASHSFFHSLSPSFRPIISCHSLPAPLPPASHPWSTLYTEPGETILKGDRVASLLKILQRAVLGPGAHYLTQPPSILSISVLTSAKWGVCFAIPWADDT